MSFKKELMGVADGLSRKLRNVVRDPELRRALESDSSDWFMSQISNIMGASSNSPTAIKREINNLVKDGAFDELTHANKRSFNRIKKDLFSNLEKKTSTDLVKQTRQESNLEFILRQGNTTNPLMLDIEREKEKLGISPKNTKSRKKEDRDNLGIVRLAKTYADIGGMYMYYYDAKTKEKLPYYDTFPLILMIDSAPKGFYGINLHYVPPEIRARIISQILENAKIYNSDSVLYQMNYDFLASLSTTSWKPCFKRYLYSQIKTQMFEVPPDGWDKAIYLPSSAFVSVKNGKSKAVSNSVVWNDSMRKM